MEFHPETATFINYSSNVGNRVALVHDHEPLVGQGQRNRRKNGARRNAKPLCRLIYGTT